MLGKLLKYDLKWVYKLVVIFYILAFIFSGVGRLLAEVQNSMLLDIVSKISIGTGISMAVSALVNCLMRLWGGFVVSVYKDESYLTHTLPVEKKTIFASKVIAGIVSVFTTTIVTIGCVFICYYSEANMQAVKALLEVAATTYNTTVLNFLLVVSLLVFVEILFILFIGFVGIVIGHRANQRKMVKSIITSFVLYAVFQVLTLVVIFIYGVFDPAVMNLINTTEQIDILSLKTLMYVATMVYSIYLVVLYTLGKAQLNKGVNVE